MPRLLAIDATANSCSVAASDGTRTSFDERFEARAHARLLLPMIDQVLREVGWAKSHIDAIVFGVGPGSFTGLRIAFGVAQGLAYGLSKPMIGVGSLECAAHKGMLQCSGYSRCLVIMDARMGEFYSASFARINNPSQECFQLRQTGSDRLIARDDGAFFAAELDAEPTLVIAVNIEGEILKPLLPGGQQPLLISAPNAGDALRLVQTYPENFPDTAPEASGLRYVRNAVASPPTASK